MSGSLERPQHVAGRAPDLSTGEGWPWRSEETVLFPLSASQRGAPASLPSSLAASSFCGAVLSALCLESVSLCWHGGHFCC